ncbi:MAG TPA: KamA family radical SAM protein, partial [Pirellulaceae bacterium]|nr:KamA family radical SAM protein [Pirellulaceae bacterium]
RQAEQEFVPFAPWDYIRRIERGKPVDPLLLQILPVADEVIHSPGFVRDPLNEFSDCVPIGGDHRNDTADFSAASASSTTRSILTKYAGRALIVLTGTCAIHCRYCFRRHYPYGDIAKSREAWGAALDMAARDPQIRELILSGGDPLTLVDEQLDWFLQQTTKIPQLERIRIHTRLPLVIPQRITTNLCAALENAGLPLAFVWHINHPREIDDLVRAAAARLKAVPNVTQLNQSVLLRGINDSVTTLAALSERLFDMGVVPYYLHQLDRVQGAAHFEVPWETGVSLIHALRAMLPGYLVPRFVIETPGAASKTVLA